MSVAASAWQAERPEPSGEPVLEVRDLEMHFPASSGRVVHAVDGVSLDVAAGESLGLVGESGSGKSTVGNCILRLLEPTGGSVSLLGEDVTHLSPRALRPLRREMHMVFQDPFSSLNPRMTCEDIVAEPLRIHGRAVEGGRGQKARRERVGELFGQVGLRDELRHRYAHELSGGQRQRVGLARALSLRPKLLVADEPVSALDVSVQAAVLNLLRDLQAELGFACLFISHDLSTVDYLCHRVAVMYLGRIVETGSTEQVLGAARHPYTQALLSAAVVPDPVEQRRRERIVLEGDIPSPLAPPSGCRFRTRCPRFAEVGTIAEEEEPSLVDHRGDGHRTRCHLADRELGG